MARIRTVKPEFYRHEELQELEIKNPDLKPMLVFSALWGHCDKNGIFEWKPRLMQLDILPFIWEATGKSLVTSLELLRHFSFIKTLTDGQKVYGYIPSFRSHQNIGGKEAQAPSKLPQPADMTEYTLPGSDGEVTGKRPGSDGEILILQEGKGREGKGSIESKEGDKSRQKPEEVIWKAGLKLLIDAGTSEKNARSLLGKHFSADKEHLASIITQMLLRPPIDPVAYLNKALQPEKPAYLRGVK